MINKVTLIGRLGKDAEHKEVNGQNLITFSIATTETYIDKNGEKVEATEWHNIANWSKTIKIAEYLKKGVLVYLEGKIKTTKKDDKYYTNIQANDIKILEFAKNSTPSSDQVEDSMPKEDGDDLPF